MKKIHSHYDNLKVSPSAPNEVIRAAYRVLAQKYHPDRNSGDSEAERIMKVINTSYEVLSDPAKRQEHDQWLAQQYLAFEQTGFSGSQPDLAPHQTANPLDEAAAFGLSKDEIEYLENPVRASHHMQKYGISEDKLSKAIGLGKIRGVLCRGVLWVQNRKIV